MSYYSGGEALKKGDSYGFKSYNKAKYFYNLALQDKDYRLAATLRLIKLEINNGMFSNAREYANSLKENGEEEKATNLLGQLEANEHNYIEALDYFTRANSIIFLANTYVQLGEFYIARKMYETFAKGDNCKNHVIFQIAFLDLIEGDYEHALKVLGNIDVTDIKDKYLCKKLYVLSMYLLGKIDQLEPKKYADVHAYKSLVSSGDSVLFEHLNKHENKSYQYGAYLYSGGVTDKILSEIREKINISNPTYTKGSLVFSLNLEDKIGYTEDKDLNGIGVITSIDRKKILTIYPIDFSSEFDKEGMIYSEELRLKRLKGVIK